MLPYKPFYAAAPFGSCVLNDSGLSGMEKIRNAGMEYLDRKDMDIKPGPRSDSCVTPLMFYLITVDALAAC